MISVKLLEITPNAEELIFKAARQCYYPGWIGDFDISNITSQDMYKLINHVFDSGHMSVGEHPTATVAISGISRACSHQLVRHRLASYSQQSQRYCGLGENNFIIPKTILNNPVALSRFNALLVSTKACYNFMIAENIPAEDARMVLPNATTTNIVMTMNFRGWLHFFEERMCKCAQWEIRDLAYKINSVLNCESNIFRNFYGPKCYRLGYCPESEKRTCGLKPLKEKVFLEYVKATGDDR